MEMTDDGEDNMDYNTESTKLDVDGVVHIAALHSEEKGACSEEAAELLREYAATLEILRTDPDSITGKQKGKHRTCLVTRSRREDDLNDGWPEREGYTTLFLQSEGENKEFAAVTRSAYNIARGPFIAAAFDWLSDGGIVVAARRLDESYPGRVGSFKQAVEEIVAAIMRDVQTGTGSHDTSPYFCLLVRPPVLPWETGEEGGRAGGGGAAKEREEERPEETEVEDDMPSQGSLRHSQPLSPLRAKFVRGHHSGFIESETLEMKEGPRRPADVAPYFTAFLNRRGGFILFGVKDDGKVVGMGKEDVVQMQGVVHQVISQRRVFAVSPSGTDYYTPEHCLHTHVVPVSDPSGEKTRRHVFIIQVTTDPHVGEWLLRNPDGSVARVVRVGESITQCSLGILHSDGHVRALQERMETAHSEEVEKLKEEIRAVRQEKAYAREEHEREMALVRAEHERTLALVRAEHERTLALVRAEHERTLALVRAEHERTLSSVRAEGERALASVREECSNAVASAAAQIASLSGMLRKAQGASWWSSS